MTDLAGKGYTRVSNPVLSMIYILIAYSAMTRLTLWGFCIVFIITVGQLRTISTMHLIARMTELTALGECNIVVISFDVRACTSILFAYARAVAGRTVFTHTWTFPKLMSPALYKSSLD